ncbi:hypothetical protein M426DRAFT_119884 [Hypoxylon sp. CI-4A]|nr:hypothetical protein M426DRAFT_119884 [Hypoxylon sp. CI-4A]
MPQPSNTKRSDATTARPQAHKRHNISKACQECRRRRIKCDGKTPDCSRCFRRGIDCLYSAEEDRRRPAPKTYVDLLRSRIGFLEQVLESNNIRIDNYSTPQAQTTLAPLRHSPPPKVTDQERLPAAHDRDNGSKRDTITNTMLSGTLSTDESLNFDQDGEARYFGPTSGRLEFRQLKGRGLESNSTSASFNQFCQYLPMRPYLPTWKHIYLTFSSPGKSPSVKPWMKSSFMKAGPMVASGIARFCYIPCCV